MFSKKDIERYYELSETHYRLHWNLEKSRSLHYGYWDDTTHNFHEALLNINNVIARHATITKHDVALDAGCGVGGSAIWMAKNIGCKVTGISLSKRQVSLATESAKKEKVDHLVTFLQKDYTATGFADNSFDVIWAIESVCYVKDKSEFLKEANRILKKGGRLVVVDIYKADVIEGRDADWMRRLAHGWAIEEHTTKEKFSRQLSETGFKIIDIEDASRAIMPSVKRLYRAWFLGIIPAKVYLMLHPKATELAKKNVDTAWLQYKTLKKRLWKYLIFSAVKE
jgi:cyclopropane fatty-acyl-phospholipid synthase-like methyltransferase